MKTRSVKEFYGVVVQALKYEDALTRLSRNIADVCGETAGLASTLRLLNGSNEKKQRGGV